MPPTVLFAAGALTTGHGAWTWWYTFDTYANRPQSRTWRSYNAPRVGAVSLGHPYKTGKQEYDYADECNRDLAHILVSLTARDPRATSAFTDSAGMDNAQYHTVWSVNGCTMDTRTSA